MPPRALDLRQDDELPFVRRVADIALATSALIAAAPALAVAAAAIKLEDSGPVLFRQERCGRDQEPFTVLKLRTMAPEAPSALHESYIAELAERGAAGVGTELQKLTGDPRVTRVGGWLRRLSLDEVPQFVNVIAGHMSVVGPRPALAYELAHYEQHHFERFKVRPGLTGLWQVSGRSRLSFKEMLDLDVAYARNRSVRLDLQILCRTPAAIGRNSA